MASQELRNVSSLAHACIMLEFGHKLFDATKKRVISIDRDTGTYERIESNGRTGRRSVPSNVNTLKQWSYQPYSTQELLDEMKKELGFSERVYRNKINEQGGASAYVNRMGKMRSIKSILDDKMYQEEQKAKEDALKREAQNGHQETLF